MQVKMPADEPRYQWLMLTETIQHFYNEDREHLDQLLLEFDRAKAEDLDEARRIFAEFCEGLERHIGWEEEILYPIFERLAGEHDCGLEPMRGEHHAIRSLLQRIDRMLDAADPRLSAEEFLLRDILAPHCAKEELLLYPILDELLTGAERANILVQMSARLDARELVEAE